MGHLLCSILRFLGPPLNPATGWGPSSAQTWPWPEPFITCFLTRASLIPRCGAPTEPLNSQTYRNQTCREGNVYGAPSLNKWGDGTSSSLLPLHLLVDGSGMLLLSLLGGTVRSFHSRLKQQLPCACGAGSTVWLPLVLPCFLFLSQMPLIPAPWDCLPKFTICTQAFDSGSLGGSQADTINPVPCLVYKAPCEKVSITSVPEEKLSPLKTAYFVYSSWLAHLLPSLFFFCLWFSVFIVTLLLHVWQINLSQIKINS